MLNRLWSWLTSPTKDVILMLDFLKDIDKMKSLKEYTPEDVVVLFNGVQVEQFYDDKDDLFNLFKPPRVPVILTVTDNKTGSCVRYDITNTLLEIGWEPTGVIKHEHS